MDFVLSQTDKRPMYLQIMDHIKRKIMVGDWGSGDALPSIRELAAAIGVSVITVKRAYLDLEREGVIVTHQGRGSFVAETAADPQLLQARELDEALARAADQVRLLGLHHDEALERFAKILAEKEKSQ